MKRYIIVAFIGAACIDLGSLAGVAMAQPLGGTSGRADATPPVKSVAPPAWNNGELVPPALVASQTTRTAGSPGETQASAETRAHELHLMQVEAAAESVHRAAMARADQRTRRLESQRWFGISNKRPTASVDPYDGDYSAFWASNYPFYPLRWVASGEPWGFVEVQP
jgi:hypothetical protein